LIAQREDNPLIFLAFIVPVAIYCFFLALINRSTRPVLVSGTWDFAGVLFAVSGLLLCGGPAILTGLYEQSRLSWLLGKTNWFPERGLHWGFWLGLWGLYFVLVLGGAVALLRSRRGCTCIYNVPADRVTELIVRSLERALVPWRETIEGNFLIQPGGADTGLWTTEAVPADETAPTMSIARHEAAGSETDRQPPCWLPIRVDRFQWMRHATLHWPSEAGALRGAIEAELQKTLAEEAVPVNPVARWLLSAALLLSSSAFLALVGLIIVQVMIVLQR
jgi:hypothetical protein